jgi:hypothetical protein
MTDSVWKPNDWLRLIALVGSFLLFAVGAYMLYVGIAAEGILDIKSTVISGTLKTASAGLFICFFAFLLIVFVLISILRVPVSAPTDAMRSSRAARLMPIFWGSLAAVFLSMLAAIIFWGSIGSVLFLPIGFFCATFSSIAFAIIRLNAEDA